jgi:hypothetical protein
VQASLAGQGIGSQIIEATPRVSSAIPANTQLLEPAPAATSSNLFGLSSEELKSIGRGALGGLQAGAIDAGMKTGIGKQAQNSGAKQWANDNGLLIGGGIAVLGSVLTYLIATRK